MPINIDRNREALVGRAVRAARRAKNLTQDELAQMLGITFQQIQKYEAGTNRVCVTRFIETMRACDVEPAQAIQTLEDALK